MLGGFDFNLRMVDKRRRGNRVTFRLVNLLFAAVFLASAALQYNDEGAVAWAALYFAGVCLEPPAPRVDLVAFGS